MAEKCVFCGAEADDFPPEHWIPAWVSRALIGPNQVIRHQSTLGDEWWARVFDLTVKCVCPDCNHHWMSDMETRASRVARTLVLGEPKQSLTVQEQNVLARWCFLKVITLELGRPADHVPTYPDFFYPGFREIKKPPSPSCSITVGRREIPAGSPYVWFRSQGEKRLFPEVGELGMYRTALCVGHLVIDVVGVLAPWAAVQVEDEDARLVRIWPTSDSKIELPAQSFTSIENNDLV